MKSICGPWGQSRKYMFFSLFFLLLALLLTMNRQQISLEALARQLSPGILRFHILANSDQKKDQEVKLEVRSLILDYLSSHLDRQAGKKETQDYLMQHQTAIEQTANAYLAKQGFSYEASLQLTNCYFPTRVYDQVVIPAGYYDAARIILGEGKGHNWWCVLYPRLCFVNETCEGVPEDSKAQLTATLNQDDIPRLKDHRPVVEIRFFLFPFFNPGSNTD